MIEKYIKIILRKIILKFLNVLALVYSHMLKSSRIPLVIERDKI